MCEERERKRKRKPLRIQLRFSCRDWRHYCIKRPRLLVKLLDAVLSLNPPNELNLALRELTGLLPLWNFKDAASDALEVSDMAYLHFNFSLFFYCFDS